MIDLRFVEREVPDWPANIVIGEPCSMQTVRILQWRQAENPLEIGLHPLIWSDWEDVPTAPD